MAVVSRERIKTQFKETRIAPNYMYVSALLCELEKVSDPMLCYKDRLAHQTTNLHHGYRQLVEKKWPPLALDATRRHDPHAAPVWLRFAPASVCIVHTSFARLVR